MSNLVLTRKAGESIRLEMLPGFYVNLCTAYVGSDQVKLELTGPQGFSESRRVNVGDFFAIGQDVKVHVSSIKFRTVRLCFEAPLNIKVARTELLGRVQ